jgi:tRNA(Ile)-lysidine synthase
MKLTKRFEQYLRQTCGVETDDRLLVAVSGGIDSVCLLFLLKEIQNDIAIIHCNFQLRGEESDEDEQFVSELGQKLTVPVFSKRFKTKVYAETHNLSIQEAAREIRYKYFENIRKANNFKYVAVAHNADDNIETFFINLIRGTGIKGITGIKPVNGNLVRPLLFAFRSEIEEYRQEKGISYRMDSSNLTDKYLRNQIRHHVIPLLMQINPSFKSTMIQNLSNFQNAEALYSHYIHLAKKDILSYSNYAALINIEKLLQYVSPKTLLFEILWPFGFTVDTIDNIFDSLKGISGKEFIGGEYKAVKDRKFMIVEKIAEEPTNNIYYIDKSTTSIENPLRLTIQHIKNENYKIKNDKNIAALDEDKLHYPLIIRRWNAGDYFQPLGMDNFKKVSDFFIDSKVPRTQKEKLWILGDGENIVWVIGMRLDNRYKITPETKNILEIRCEY